MWEVNKGILFYFAVLITSDVEHLFVFWSWWWTGRPGVLRFVGSQRVGHDWATEMKWTELNLVLEKAGEPEIKLPTSAGSSKKQESSRKTSISALLTMPKTLTVWITTNWGKFWKRWEYHTTWPASWEICSKSRSNSQKWTWNRLVPNRKKSMSRLYIVILLI